jgi:hypothetical protein
VPIPRRREERRSDARFFVAAEDAGRLELEAPQLIERALGVQWYDVIGNDADAAALALCRLRRSRAGARGGPEYGDAAVREVLTVVSPDALAWITSRAISYLDENGFPEAVERFIELDLVAGSESASADPERDESP